MRQRRTSRYEETARAIAASDAADVAAAPRVHAPAVPVFEPMPPSSRTDPLTGALLPGEWNRILADEDARIHRYGRPATVVLVELDGLDRLVAILGQEAGDRILPAVADSLSRHARGADHIARLGPGRFGVLLPETGEVEAVNYVERVRAGLRAVARVGGDRPPPGHRLGQSRGGLEPERRVQRGAGADVRRAPAQRTKPIRRRVERPAAARRPRRGSAHPPESVATVAQRPARVARRVDAVRDHERAGDDHVLDADRVACAAGRTWRSSGPSPGRTRPGPPPPRRG